MKRWWIYAGIFASLVVFVLLVVNAQHATTTVEVSVVLQEPAPQVETVSNTSPVLGATLVGEGVDAYGRPFAIWYARTIYYIKFATDDGGFAVDYFEKDLPRISTRVRVLDCLPYAGSEVIFEREFILERELIRVFVVNFDASLVGLGKDENVKTLYVTPYLKEDPQFLKYARCFADPS